MRALIRQLGVVVAFLAAAVIGPASSSAITVDGQLDPSYKLQTTQTTQALMKNSQGLATFSNGQELDAAYAAIDNGTLYLFFTGNLLDTIDGTNPKTDASRLSIFFDTQSGGQNPLTSEEPETYGYSYIGLTFESSFTPDYWIQFTADGALENSFARHAWYEALPAGGGGVSYLLGSGTNAGAPGTLSGGTNPYGIEATIDNRNTAGISVGCGAGLGADGVTTGVELAIPLAAIGNPTGCFGMSAFLEMNGIGQMLPSLPVGMCTIGLPSGVNFANIPGTHYLTVCTASTPTHHSTWGMVKSIYR